MYTWSLKAFRSHDLQGKIMTTIMFGRIRLICDSKPRLSVTANTESSGLWTPEDPARVPSCPLRPRQRALYIHTCIQTCIRAYIYTCKHMHSNMHIDIHIYTHTHVNAYIHTYSYIYTYIHTYIHT